MKLLFTLILSLVFCSQQVYAQAPVTTSALKPFVIFYNTNWEVTKKENAAYSRIAYLPERLKDIQNLHQPKFNGPVRDYFANGKLWAVGSYNEGRKWGAWSFYYANGQLDCRGEFDNTLPKGKWQFWYPDGKLLMEATFDKADMYLHNFWNDAGEQTIKEGNGIYSIITQDEKGREMKMEGSFLNGRQAGVWTYGPVGGPVEMTQDLDNRPAPIKDRVIIGNTNPFSIDPVPNYLVGLENWEPDNAVYEKKYPVIADVIESEVQRIDINGRKDVSSDHYYKIIQQINGSTDTLEHGIPIIYPDFKSLHSYFERNFRIPASLKGQRIKGLMVVGFSIEKDGSITNVRILRSLNPVLDNEAIKLFKNMPKQKPAMLYTGEPISGGYTFPIRVDVRTSSIESEFSENGLPAQRRPVQYGERNF